TINLENYYPHSGNGINDLPCNEEAVTFCKCILDWDNNGVNYPNDIPHLKITGPNNFQKTIIINKGNVWKKHTITLAHFAANPTKRFAVQ
ncbi:MAG: hypothetical protein Q7U47_05925, partial [Paludibacter sp.]|nr:hypothetical protein [Paludibacter sp.]